MRNPALLLWGADESLHERALLLQRAIPRADLHVLQGCGHWPQAARPDRTFDIVNAFLREESGSTPWAEFPRS